MECFGFPPRHHRNGLVQWLPCTSENIPDADHQYYSSSNFFSQFVDLNRLEKSHMHHGCAVLDLTKLNENRSLIRSSTDMVLSRDSFHHRRVVHRKQSVKPYEGQTQPRQADAERQDRRARVCHALKSVVHVPQPHVDQSGHRRPAGLHLSHKSSNDFSRGPPYELHNNYSTMASSRILHDGSSRSLAIKRSDESSSSCGVPLSKKCSGVHRTRSRSIAIKRVPLPKSEESNSVSEYDWATWRMYNRIIEYRRKHPINYMTEESREDDEASPGKDSSLNLLQHALPNCPESSALVGCSDYGDIFQLDM